MLLNRDYEIELIEAEIQLAIVEYENQLEEVCY